MKPIKQENLMGCGIACTAFVLNKNYKITKKYFKRFGNPDTTGFTCKSIVNALKKGGKNYRTKYLRKRVRFEDNSIVFIKRSSKYPHGHYLVYKNKKWMDPWINLDLTNINIKKAKAGFRKKLPGRAIYSISEIK